MRTENIEKYDAMEGFKPKIMDNVYQGDFVLSILDGIDAWLFFKKAGGFCNEE